MPERFFGHARPSGLRSTVPQEPLGNQQFRPLPPPTGKPPYHLALDSVIRAEVFASIKAGGGISFHVIGDTGGVSYPALQEAVADAMESDIEAGESSGASASDIPAFLYHLGDVVYYYGEPSQYYAQFYEPYMHYRAPIFAIPGNHDGEPPLDSKLSPETGKSLEGFVRNFCAPVAELKADAGSVSRHAMTQPNVYWTLETPFVFLVGLYSNVPEGGVIRPDQLDWLTNELTSAPKEIPVIVSLHHAPFSLDSHHAGSLQMVNALDNAFARSGRVADAVFAGHVHNYQRFTRRQDAGGEGRTRDVPYVIAGASGFYDLNYMQKARDGGQLEVPMVIPGEPNVTLENYCQGRLGFLRVKVDSITKTIHGEYYAVSTPDRYGDVLTQQLDVFELDYVQHKLIKSAVLP